VLGSALVFFLLPKKEREVELFALQRFAPRGFHPRGMMLGPARRAWITGSSEVERARW